MPGLFPIPTGLNAGRIGRSHMTLPNLYLGRTNPAFPCTPLRWASPSNTNTPVRWRWPEPGQERIRKLLSRAAMRPIYRFTSWKLGRSVQLESALEEQVALQLDACPTIDAYAEQPALLEFLTPEGERTRHVPDFAVSHRGTPGFLEIKFARDVDERVLQRTELLIRLLAPLGIGYRLVTEIDLPGPARLANAWCLLSRGRQSVTEVQVLLTHQQARIGMTLGDLGWNQPTTARQLARQILEGRLSVDLSQRLGAGTMAFTTKQEEGWLWA